MKKMPRRVSAALPLLFLSLACFGLPSCLAVRRKITRTGTGTGANKTVTLLTADRATLRDVIVRQYEAIRDFNATVDLVPALGSAEKSKITEYKDVRGYILFRRPASIRIIGLFPVMRTKAFDMVSTGPDSSCTSRPRTGSSSAPTR
jgi:hypothetical protein